MRLELTGRHLDITPALRRLVDVKLAKLDRMLGDRALSAHAVLTRDKHRHRVDITLHARGENFLHGVSAAGSWEASIGEAMERIVEQVQKVKGKLEAQRRGGRGRVATLDGAAADAPAKPVRAVRPRMPQVVRTSRQVVKTMSLAVAARQVGPDGDDVVVFRDGETGALGVLYRARSGELTLIETET